MRKPLYIIALLLAFIGLAACSEEPRDFTYYQPGEYKGTVDPLLNKNIHEELNNRFMLVQTDR